MNPRKIDHIGIAVRDASAAAKFFAEALGLAPGHEEVLEAMKLKIVHVRVGDVRLEFTEPLAGEEAVSKFLSRSGEGVHHIGLDVPDAEAASRELAGRGLRLVWEKPKAGAGGRRVNFVHPGRTFGVLVEFSSAPHDQRA